MRSLVERRKQLLTTTTAAVLAALTATACSPSGSAASGGGGAPAKQGSNTLRIAVPSAPPSLDPALSGSADPLDIFPDLAYESLIQRAPDGSLVPGLATKWGYVDQKNMVFEITLRQGVKFSDGGQLTAQGVEDFFNYYKNAGGGFASRIDEFASMEVVSDNVLRITLKKPDPLLPFNFTPRMVTGAVISPLALKDPKKLGTATAGAGQYVLDADKTVTGQKYVYNASSTYYNQSAIKWKTVEVDVIPNTTNQLNAMRSNQIDYMYGTSNNADAAVKAGFNVYTQPQAFLHVQILDRDGKKVPALGDPRVRQALNYAVDRNAIMKGLLGKYGHPGDEMAIPGDDGYSKDLEGMYPYDVAKAKKLLAEAGYANGFSFDMAAFNLQPGITQAAQAVASYWSAIGVTANIRVPSSQSEYGSMLIGKQVDAQMFQYGSRPMLSFATEVLTPGSFFNPFGNKDSQVTNFLGQLATASQADSPKIAQQLQKRMLELGWFVPLGYVDKVVIARPGLVGAQMNSAYLNPNPVYFSAK